MGLTNRKRKAYRHSHYNINKDKAPIKTGKLNKTKAKETKREWYGKTQKRFFAHTAKNMLDPDKKKKIEKDKYASQPDQKKTREREKYASQPDQKKLGRGKNTPLSLTKRKLGRGKNTPLNLTQRKLGRGKKYASQSDQKKTREREKYASDPIRKSISNRDSYFRHLKSRLSKVQYRYQKCKSKILLQKQNAYYKSNKADKAAKLLKRAKSNKHLKAKAEKSRQTVHSYSLHEPNQLTRGIYAKLLKRTISRDASLRKVLLAGFRESNKYNVSSMKATRLANAVSHIAVRKLLSQALKQRKQCAGELLQAIRKVNDLELSADDFGQCFHTASSEPFFYEESYYHHIDRCTHTVDVPALFKEQVCKLKGDSSLCDEDRKDMIAYLENEIGDANCCNCQERTTPIVIDEKGRCRIAREIGVVDTKTTLPSKWKCTHQCKLPTNEQRQQIMDLKDLFKQQVRKVRQGLNHVDSGCHNNHYGCRLTGRPLHGHPPSCITSGCDSKLRILRAVAPHYPLLHRFLSHLYDAIGNHTTIDSIDCALKAGNFELLARLCGIDNCKKLFGSGSETSNTASDLEDATEKPLVLQQPKLPDLEAELIIDNAAIILQLDKLLADDPEFACCSCERLHQRKNVTAFDLSDSQKFTSDMWQVMKAYIYMCDADATEKKQYVCQYCRPILNRNNMPGRCVLNGLEVEPIPVELQNLDPLSKQLIQRGKAFQAVFRLGTYTGKVPSHNSIKACKGTMFFLPLPLEKTVQTLEEVENKVDGVSVALPNPELFIIVNSKSKNNNMVWQSLINVSSLKDALGKLREINWLYADVDVNSLDDASKQIVESVSVTTSTMLQKVSSDDVASYQSYTIRRLDQKESSIPDTDQYKLTNVKEDALSNKLKHLDVLCFPTLFPSGKFGEGHKRNIHISASEIVKSRLLNKDGRFRKDDQYVFYLLWQKEMRELQAGVYNLLKGTRQHAMPVGQFIDRVSCRDDEVEGNLSTIFQSVRGSKQYWFLRNSELMCMLREFGPPTFFLTLSCAEYDSPEIDAYLRKVNDVSASYPIQKLCTEDPLSVSRKFSQKFHDFFNAVILKGAVLGTVTHHFYKKEYQSRGAPHYHILLWIDGAPIAGSDDDEEVLRWIQERITCRIPDKDSNPELHQLVTKYQYHKCSKYCQRKKRVRGGTFITRCRFGFPRDTCETATLFSVEECMKLAHRKMYQLPRSPEEIRINNYNPLLLMLWKANMDLQYIGESTLAIARYVTGYVTKAERSNMQELWQEVSSHASVYSKLWSFGIRCLRSRECGLYEASDLLLGDHLCGKSETVKWVDVSMPQNRKRRLRDHSKLVEMREVDPDSTEIFENNLLDTFYPQRPADMEDVCLYEFVAEYTKSGMDTDGNVTYRKLTKPVLPNHKIYNPNREEEREYFYYSLLLLFVPFRDESSLIAKGENAESAFNRHLKQNTAMNTHSNKLQRMLKAQESVEKINEARQAQEQSVTEPQPVEDDSGPQVVGEAMSAMHDVLDLNRNSDSDDAPSLEELVSSLNVDQGRVFEQVKSHLEHQALHENGACKCTDIKPLHMFVSGVGGTGKSFLIKTIRALVSKIWNDSDSAGTPICAVTAPTGLAAFNVGGVTIHRLLQLPIEHEGKAAGYWKLSKDALKVMRASLSQLRLLIIDEISMVSSLNLAYIHLRLDEIFAKDEWFGGVNVLFVGDILQLPPVNGGAVFERICNKSITNKLGCMTSVNIWQVCIDYDELTINERQKKDETFSLMLDEIRRGCASEKTIQSLEDRVITTPVVDKFEELLSSKKSPLCLFPTRTSCQEFNTQMLSRLDSETKEIPCIDEVDETLGTYKWNQKSKEALEKMNVDCNLTAGLEAVLKIAVGARVMLRRNIDTSSGLVNGAIGTVIAIKAHHITVQFDGRQDLFHVERVKSRFMVMKKMYVHRKQFPLILAFAVTVHKCQGLSLECAIMDLSNQVFCPGMAYVALSRVRSLENLHLIAFSKEAIKVSSKCLEEINRLRKTYRPDLPQYTVPLAKQTNAPKRKRKLTGVVKSDAAPAAKCIKVSTGGTKQKAPEASTTTKSERKKPVPPKRKLKKGTRVRIRTQLPIQQHNQYKYNPFTPDFQQQACRELGLQYICDNGCTPGGPDVALNNPRTIEPIQGDGNCLYRAFSYVITGSQSQHSRVRSLIVEHLRSFIGTETEIRLLTNYMRSDNTIDDYIARTRMEQEGAWGSNIDMAVLAHRLNVNIASFDARGGFYSLWSCDLLQPDRYFDEDQSRPTIFIYYTATHDHFNVILSQE